MEDSKKAKPDEPTLFDELRRLAWRFVPQPRRETASAPKEWLPSTRHVRHKARDYSDDERQKVSRVLYELGSASAELLDALVAACDTHYDEQGEDLKAREALVTLLDGWDSDDPASAKNLAITEHAMILARDRLLVLSDDPAWMFSDELTPAQIEAMRECLQSRSLSKPATQAGKGNTGETLAKALVREMLPDEVRDANPKRVDRLFDYRLKRPS